MKKFTKSLLGFGLAAAMFAGCSGGSSAAPTSGSATSSAAPTNPTSATGTYKAYVTGYDWGCGVDKVVLSLDAELASVTAESFKVVETKNATDWTTENFEVKVTDFDRQVTKAYLSDENGTEVTTPSKYVTLELYVSPSDGSPFNYFIEGRNAWCDPYELTITNDAIELNIDKSMTEKITNADAFKLDTFTATDGTKYDYAGYKVEGSDALFVWLHGGGEGGGIDGTDPLVPLLANKVTALIGDEFQSVTGGMSVLAPQCPDYWMHTAAEDYTVADQETLYYESLHELIAKYAEECGAKKIVISGCSNGGYMTMVMAIKYGSEYTAFVPICEGLQDQFISDADIAKIKDLPLFFIYSEDDTTLDPTVYSAPTIKRLQDAGASNLKVSTTEHVVDTSGKYFNEDGSQYMYAGHWSWIYFDNNESLSNDDNTPVWQWIANNLK